jgi:hypothetical protein
MFQIFPEKSVHRQQHTVRGWSVWVAIVTGTWIIAFIIGESSEWFFVRRRAGCSGWLTVLGPAVALQSPFSAIYSL